MKSKIQANTSFSSLTQFLNKLEFTFSMKNLTFIALSLIISSKSYAQLTTCDPDDIITRFNDNLVNDPDFNTGNFSTFQHDGNYVEGFNGNGSSDPGELFIVNNASILNAAFAPLKGYGGSGNFYMIDGSSTLPNKFWSQQVPLTNNRWYYFEIYVMTVYDNTPGDPSDLANFQFRVGNGSGGTAFTFPKTFKTPTTVGQWTLFADSVYYTGPTGIRPLEIWNTSGGNFSSGNDFAIDHILIQEGCAFAGNNTPSPTLPAEITLCGTTGTVSIKDFGLNCTDPTLSILWSNGSTSCSTTVNTSQNLALCVQKTGSCMKSALTAVVTNYDVDLGPDIQLCNPSTHTLTATLSGQHPGKSIAFRWLRNGLEVTGAITKNLTVNQSGQYIVETFDSICGAKYDTVLVSHLGISPKNDTICMPGNANLSVTGALSANVSWYTNATGGAPIAANSLSYNPTGLTTTRTYYAEYNGNVPGTVGKTNAQAGFYTDISKSPGLIFTTTTANVRIDSVTVYKSGFPGFNIQLTVFNATTGGTAIVGGVTGNINIPAAPTFTAVRIPVGITIPTAGTYRLQLTTSGGDLYISNNNLSFPYTDANNIISITGTSLDGSVKTDNYAMFYNWKFSYPNTCPRTPVIAVNYCPCIAPTAPTTLTLTPGNTTICPSGSVNFSAVSDKSGANYVWQWYKNDIAQEYWETGNTNFSATTAGKYGVRIALKGDLNCSILREATVSVNTPPTINLGPDVALCNPSSVTLDAGAGFTSYIWYRNNVVYPYSSTRNLLVNDEGTYRVEASHACGTVTDEVIFTLGAGALNPTNSTVCPPTLGTFTVSGATNYAWYSTATGGSAIAGQTTGTYNASVATNPTTYWVENSSTSSFNVGPTSHSDVNNFTGTTSVDFTANRAFSLTSAQISLYFDLCTPTGPKTVSVTLKNSSGVILRTQNFSISGTGAPSPLITLTGMTGFNIPSSGNYVMEVTSASCAQVISQSGQNSFFNTPLPSAANNILNFTSATNNTGTGVSKWSGLINWVITAPTSACARTPVVAAVVCPCTAPTITKGVTPNICAGASSTTLPYTSTTGAPNQYKIDWNAAANAAGVKNVAYTALPPSPINITGLGDVGSGTYAGTLYVRNSTSPTCESVGVAVSFTINATPDITQYACTGFQQIEPSDFGFASGSNKVSGSTDISSKFSLPIGSIIVNVTDVNTSGNAFQVPNGGAANKATFSFSGTKPIKTKVAHGDVQNSAVGGRDAIIAEDGVPYIFTGALNPEYSSHQTGNHYYSQLDALGNVNAGPQIWESLDFATGLSFYTIGNATTNGFNVRVCAQIELVVCDKLQLPVITGTNLSGNESYYSATNGGGTSYKPGDYVSSNGSYYIYDASSSTPSCKDEEEFKVKINITPTPDAPSPVAVCDSYTLPALTAGNAYYTATNKGGSLLAAGSKHYQQLKQEGCKNHILQPERARQEWV